MWPLLYRRASPKLLIGLAIALSLALGPVAPAQPQSSPLRITQVTVKVFGDTVQLSIVATGPLTYRTLQLSSPPRLIIDLPGAMVDPAIPPLMEVDKGGVARVRVGQIQDRPPMARVAVDLETALPFTLATSTPQVLVAKFASRGNVAAPPAAPAAPIAPPAPVVQAPPAPPPAAPPQPVPVAQATPVTTPGRITLEFRNTELADVLSALAKVCNVNIVTDASVKGTITVRLIDLSCDEALRFILEANNLGFRRIGRNLIIMAAEKLAPPPEAPEAITYPVGFAVAKDVADAIRAAVPGIRVTSDARSNAVVVVGTQHQHEEVRKILVALDIQLTQIEIEARVVDISASVLRELGLNWGLTSTCTPPACTIFSIQGTFPNQITIGVGAFNISGVLTAMVTDGRARVLSAPRVAVIDGNEAQVNLGDEIPIPQTDASGRTTFTFKPVGVILRVTPKANRDGFITTKVEPEVSSVVRLITSVGAQVPQIATRKATTIVTVRNGESIIIAGLISAEERRTTIKVPLLGDIPIIGQLFRSTTTERKESEVIFIVTPHIVSGPGAAPAPTATPRP
ncbi:MAG: AMIN domain-containing protein [Armatimonadetes bacterium]|nr:AMIN domain-containing protein [Armatimonadota bacterium]